MSFLAPSVPASLTLYSDWHFCSACGNPPLNSEDFVSGSAGAAVESSIAPAVVAPASISPSTTTKTNSKTNSNNKKKKKKKLSTCKRCKTVAYHNAECQKNHWKCGHKRDCKLLAEAIQPLLEISKCWDDFRSRDTGNNNSDSHSDSYFYSWWDANRLDPRGARESRGLWETSEVRWNRYGEYLEAMDGFQKALDPVARLWNSKNHKKTEAAAATNTNTGDSNNKTKPKTDNGFDDSGEQSCLAVSNMSLQENKSNNNTNTSSTSKANAGIALARKLLFCSYCEADGNQVKSSRMRLAQCISILLECAFYITNYNSNGSLDHSPPQKRQSTSSNNSNIITYLLNDAWMELMLSYEEEEEQEGSSSRELRTISRHVVHMAIQSSCGNTLYRCEWMDPLQRPGYMAKLENPNAALTNHGDGNGNIDNAGSKQQQTLFAPPYIPRQDHPQWCQILESHWKEIAAELSSLVQTNHSNNNYYNHSTTRWTVVGSGDRGSGGDDHRVVSPGGKWTEYVLFGTGSANSTADAPFTKNLLRRCVPDAVSLAEAGGGEVIFSKLEANTRIEAHCGPTNFRWTAHLGLVIPAVSSKANNNCSIRVAKEWHHWQTGKVLLFDDSYEHEIRNDTDEIRIVLLLRLWHPWLPSRRRQAELNKAILRKEEAIEKRYKAPEV